MNGIEDVYRRRLLLGMALEIGSYQLAVPRLFIFRVGGGMNAYITLPRPNESLHRILL